MARRNATFWHRYKFLLSGLVLLFSAVFFYQSLHPSFPPSLASQQLNEFEVTPMPLDLAAPYQHDGAFIKDFMVLYNAGNPDDIRQAFMSIGPQPIPFAQHQQLDLGILHGSRYGLHVHALAPEQFSAADRIWLTIERWQGERHTISWPLPQAWLE
ncbi:hypothetical protein JYB87_02885 [Shewanella avicenniae]|uniref:Inactive transglutaminase fused to 7 transmembrane helices domain-containing protein n=1 Tax=Shewanella avicenniae TaxID=2814294 RepID=A0ABX7QRY3_9GAMM|nr:hypothetical protein [Shewanella avicenniae]QSX34212.1 hypothetical protein JYB87_02885 [Shewanella avicenniae]